MPNSSPIVTLDVIQAATDRDKCYNCQTHIKKGDLKGVITVDVDVTNKITGEIKPVEQNRSLCSQCVSSNVQSLMNHLTVIARKIGIS